MRTPTKQRIVVTFLAGLLALACVACGPEDGRARGDGPGADVGNKPTEVHPKSKVFDGQAP